MLCHAGTALLQGYFQNSQAVSRLALRHSTRHPIELAFESTGRDSDTAQQQRVPESEKATS